MEAAPRMDTSRPSNLRLAAFALTALGALVIGVGSILTWVTVGIAGQTALDSPTRGTDIRDGKIALACAIAVLVLVIVSRLVGDLGRAIVAGVIIVAGALAALVSLSFLRSASTKYVAVDSAGLVAKVAQAEGKTVAQAAQELAQMVEKLGAFTRIGAGPWVTLGGGVMVVIGGVLTVVWAARLSATHAAAEEDLDAAGADVDMADDPTDPSLD